MEEDPVKRSIYESLQAFHQFYVNADGLERLLINIVLTLVIIIVIKITIRLFSRMIRRFSFHNEKFTALMCSFFIKVVQVLAWLFGILVILQTWGINLAPVIAGLGVTGVILGFALQESISSFFSGLMLVVNNPFGLGDFVDIGSVSGTVASMDIMSVTLITIDNKRITLSNKNVWGGTIVNYSAMDTRRVDMVLGVAYGTDIARAKQVIIDLLESYPDVLKDPAPAVEVGELSDSSVNLLVRPWVSSSSYWDVKWRFQCDILKACEKAGIEIPYNKLDVNIMKNNS